MYNSSAVRELHAIYRPVKGKISERLGEFEKVWKAGSEEDIFAEFAFCLLTPQSKAKSCWAAVESLRSKKLLQDCECRTVARELVGVRFHNNKSKYIRSARELFTSGGRLQVRGKLQSLGAPAQMREWLVQNVLGMGYKEASHFLRNVGFGKDIAILDRHILKNLRGCGVIARVPRHITKKTYLEIEEKLRKFAHDVKIPMAHLDLLLWYKEAGEVFK